LLKKFWNRGGRVRKVLWILVWVAVIASLGIAVQRIGFEAKQVTVELVYDFRSLEHLADLMGGDIKALLQDLRGRGVGAIAVAPYNLLEAALAGEEIPHEVLSYAEAHRDRLDLLWDMPVVFPRFAYEAIQEAGLKAVPRLGNPPWGLPESWRAYDPTLVILGAVESPGYPDRLAEYATVLQELGARVGVVEFAQQKGVQALTSPSQMVRVHGINQRELESLTPSRIVARYMRAVRERNIRILYLRPFLEGEGQWERSLNVLAGLTGELQAAGYRLGESTPFPEWQVPRYISWIVWTGIWAAAALLAGAWVKVPAGVLLLLCGTGLVGTLGIAARSFQLAQQGMALLAAVAFPCLALQVTCGRSTLARFALISGVSVAGGFVVAGCLTGTEYLIKLAEFRGVKAMHVLPVGIAALGAILQPILPLESWRALWGRLRSFWDLSIPLKVFIVGGTALVCAGAVYVLRTGNFGLPVAKLEVEFRELLERLLVIRPRTKEFLIGHPALYFILKKDGKGLSAGLAPIAIIGQLSMVNTFSHIHTPLLVTLYRTGYGLLFGYIMGWIVFHLYELGKGLWTSDRGFGVSRFWQSGR
jgi:hypothetical protein